MNFDQKAVKFLANFYINGGRHWARGSLKSTPLLFPKPTGRTVLLLSLKETPHREEVQLQPLTWPICTQVLHKDLLEQRPPILVDLDVPGPTKYTVFDMSFRQSSPRSNLSTSCKSPAHKSGGHKTPGTQKLQSKHLPMQKTKKVHTGTVAGESCPCPIACICRQAYVHPPRSIVFSGNHLPSWIHSSRMPDPGTYCAEDCDKMHFLSVPEMIIQGVRRPKTQAPSVTPRA